MGHGQLLARSRLLLLVYSLFSPYKKYLGIASAEHTRKKLKKIELIFWLNLKKILIKIRLSICVKNLAALNEALNIC
jgi:hypothetical protein